MINVIWNHHHIYPYHSYHDQCTICKQLGSRWDTELLGVSSESNIIDTRTILSPILTDFEVHWKLQKTTHLPDYILSAGLGLINVRQSKMSSSMKYRLLEYTTSFKKLKRGKNMFATVRHLVQHQRCPVPVLEDDVKFSNTLY